jgi:hypothetical protein
MKYSKLKVGDKVVVMTEVENKYFHKGGIVVGWSCLDPDVVLVRLDNEKYPTMFCRNELVPAFIKV